MTKKQRFVLGESYKQLSVHNMLLSVGSALQGHKVQWHTDNQNITGIIYRGSMKTNLQEIVEDVVHLCTHSGLGSPGGEPACGLSQ